MIISVGRSRKDTRWRSAEMTWDQFCHKLEEPYRTRETASEYRSMSKDAKSAVKDVGGFVGGRLNGGRRKAQNVIDRCMITLDLDNASPDAWKDDILIWGFTCCVYSTHSHTPDEPRLRLIIPLDRAVPVEQYEPIARMVASWVGIDQMDPSTYEPCRLMYWPSCPSDGEYIFERFDGDILEADTVLQEYGPDEAWKDSRLWPTTQQETVARAKEIKQQGEPTEKPGIVGLFCRTYDVPEAIETFLPGVYVPGSEGRYTYAAGSTVDGAVLYEDGAFLYSHHGTDPCCGLLCNAFDLVRIHLFGDLDDASRQDDITKRPSYQKMSELASDDPEVKVHLVEERQARAAEVFGDLVEDAAEEGTAAEQPEDDWQQRLQINRKTGEADALIENARLIMEHDPRLAGRFGINDFSSRIMIRQPLPWHPRMESKEGDLWTRADDAGLRNYLEQAWKLRGKAVIDDAFQLVIRENRFDPIREYLEGLEWDGEERLDTMLIRHLGAEDTPYVRAVSRKWAVAAVRRIFEPGCKFDTMLVLIGSQGAGKSQFSAILSRGHFSDSVVSIGNKDSFDSLRGKWIIEMSELTATRKADNEAIKAFFSKQVDSFRPAYEPYVIDCPRRCVFIGTTNDREFLKDETGGRRFWPVDCSGVRKTVVGRMKSLRSEVDQLWAEAVARYRAGEKTYEDTEELLEQTLEVQASFQQQDEWVGMLQDYLDRDLPEDWETMTAEQRRDYIQRDSFTDLTAVPGKKRSQVSIAEIRYEMLGEDLRRSAGGANESTRHLSRLMNVMPGWERAKNPRFTVHGRQKVYVRLKPWETEDDEED